MSCRYAFPNLGMVYAGDPKQPKHHSNTPPTTLVYLAGRDIGTRYLRGENHVLCAVHDDRLDIRREHHALVRDAVRQLELRSHREPAMQGSMREHHR